MSPSFVTVLDSQAEQWDSDESVFCYLAHEKCGIQVVRERLRLPKAAADDLPEVDSLQDGEGDHICSRVHLDSQTTEGDLGFEKDIQGVPQS